jgi:hypothetical protein
MNKYLSLDNVGINIISGNNENNDNENNDSNNYNYVTMPDT